MTKIKEGQKAPLFTGIDQDGNKISLSDFKGSKVILYFYPKDMTPGCTTQACNFRDDYKLYKKKNIKIIGVSKDDSNRHKRFIEKYELPFPLVADTDTIICKKYDVWKEKSFMGRKFMGIVRSTFVIDEKGKMVKIFNSVKVKNHSKELLDFLEQ